MTTSATARKPARTPVPMNGVDTPNLLATISAVGAQPDLAKFKFRARGRWVTGTQSEVTMHGFFGAGGEHTHVVPYRAAGDHPAVLCGADAAPTPVEWVLHALASCLIGGIGNISAARGIKLDKADVTIEGDIDLRGILGLSKDVRNGFQGIRVAIAIEGGAPPEKLKDIAMQAKARSAVFDMLTNGAPVTIGVTTSALN
ncbi:MAG: OsmC family protein [Pseudolabrys sp.]|nr:OsmC family protein [Pseudolabrys sp.]